MKHIAISILAALGRSISRSPSSKESLWPETITRIKSIRENWPEKRKPKRRNSGSWREKPWSLRLDKGRCLPSRNFSRIDQQDQQEEEMGYQGGGFGGQREMFKAVCAECKKECEVPFKPRDNRPIYCKECFAKRKNEGR